jgi:hypothetical protein
MKSLHSPALLRIIKIFRIQLIENQIYKDLEDDSTFYFAIPYHFTWEKFKQVTMSVKNNLDNSNFDAASGFVYQKELIELVRIYIKNSDTARLKAIQERYNEEILKIRDDAL